MLFYKKIAGGKAYSPSTSGMQGSLIRMHRVRISFSSSSAFHTLEDSHVQNEKMSVVQRKTIILLSELD